MDVKLLFEQYTKFSLKLISPMLFELTEDKSILYFHDSERSDLFFIRLNEFLNTSFPSPLDRNKKVSVFQLMEDYCLQFRYNEDFNNFLLATQETKDFFFKKRYYKYYISPHDIDFEISFSELINFQSNYSKHSYYHLTIIKDKLKKHFKKNNITGFESEDYNEHLSYFKETVLDDRLNFNQTHMVEKLGDLFLSYWELLNSRYQSRIREAILEFIEENGRLVKWNIEKPEDISEVEEFFWTIKGLSRFKRERLTDYIPKTWYPLIEEETSIDNMIERNR